MNSYGMCLETVVGSCLIEALRAESESDLKVKHRRAAAIGIVTITWHVAVLSYRPFEMSCPRSARLPRPPSPVET